LSHSASPWKWFFKWQTNTYSLAKQTNKQTKKTTQHYTIDADVTSVYTLDDFPVSANLMSNGIKQNILCNRLLNLSWTAFHSSNGCPDYPYPCFIVLFCYYC
jgi:hypothetical protein